MKSSVPVVSLSILLFAGLPVFAADHAQQVATTAGAPHAQQSVTHGMVTVEGQQINYKAVAGILVIKNDIGQPYTSMSYVAYVKSGVRNESTRPITFIWNGGPGSSSVWIHMLAYGPKLVQVPNGLIAPPAPYKLENNNDSLLDATDEVFVDEPATGLGRIVTKKEGGVGTSKMVLGVDPDSIAFTRFITEYLSEYNRWNSPKFIYGESYGTTRAAAMAPELEAANVSLNGIILQSAVLNFDIFLDSPKRNPGVNIAYATGLPSYAATAWYHHKLPDQPQNLLPFLRKVEHFAMNDYLLALDQGDSISAAHKEQIAETMHQYIGLPVAYILKDDLKVSDGQFSHELLSDEGDLTGRLDTRYSGPAIDPMAESGAYPLTFAIGGPTVGLFLEYLHNTLHFGSGMHYRVGLPNQFAEQSWSMKHNGHAGTLNVMPDLAIAMKLDPHLKVLLTGGYFDIGTPYYSAEYEMHQLPIPNKLQNNISYAFFPSGHMVYLNPEAHKGLHDAVAKFIEDNSADN